MIINLFSSAFIFGQISLTLPSQTVFFYCTQHTSVHQIWTHWRKILSSTGLQSILCDLLQVLSKLVNDVWSILGRWQPKTLLILISCYLLLMVYLLKRPVHSSYPPKFITLHNIFWKLIMYTHWYTKSVIPYTFLSAAIGSWPSVIATC